jgi:hypothetical protein
MHVSGSRAAPSNLAPFRCERLRGQASQRSCPRQASLQTSEEAWNSALQIKSQLSDAVAIQNFPAAARLRDELTALDLSAVQQMELDCVHQLETGDLVERKHSLAKLRQLCPVCERSQVMIAECLKEQELTVCSSVLWNIDSSASFVSRHIF